MKVKLLTGMALDRANYAAGEVVEMDEKEATRFIERGLAEPVREERYEKAAKVSK